MTVKLQDTSQLSTSAGLKFVVYGEAKLGKTRLAATLPNPVILSTEKGLLSLKEFRLPYIEIENMPQLAEAYEWCLKSTQSRQFNSIVLDSISDMAEIVLAEEAKKHGKNGFGRWNETNDKVMQLYRDFRNLSNKHVYFVAKQEWDKDDQGMTKNRPSMPGKNLTQQLPYMFDGVFQIVRFRAQDGTLTTALRTTGDNQNVAGDRSGRLAEWEPPDLGAIIKKIMG